jgi:hypothetical protein
MKMNLDEIEEEYKVRKEEIEKEFLDSLKAGADLKQIEAEYRKKLLETIAEYKGNVSYYLKYRKLPPSTRGFKVVHTDPFKFEGADMRFTRWQRIKFALDLTSFRFKVRLRRIINWAYYPHLAYFFKKARLKLRKLFFG